MYASSQLASYLNSSFTRFHPSIPSFSLPPFFSPYSSQRGHRLIISTNNKDLQKAYADYDAGAIERDELVKAQDRAAEDSVTKMSQTGETFVTDGEQRASSFATYPIIDSLGGKGLADNLAADGQYFVRLLPFCIALCCLSVPL